MKRIKKYISIDRECIARNRETGSRDPVICIEFEDDLEDEVHCDRVMILGPSTVVYDPDNDDENGDVHAKAWVETHDPIDAFFNDFATPDKPFVRRFE